MKKLVVIFFVLSASVQSYALSEINIDSFNTENQTDMVKVTNQDDSINNAEIKAVGNAEIISDEISCSSTDVSSDALDNSEDMVTNTANNTSKTNSGLTSEGSQMKDAIFSDEVEKSQSTTDNNSKINTEIKISNSSLKNSTFTNSGSKSKVQTKDNSKANTGIDIGE